jgi:hypothetical protein
VTTNKTIRSLLRRLLVTAGLLVVLSAIGWTETSDGPHHLEGAVAFGVGAWALLYGIWWLGRRTARRARSAFHQGYQSTVVIKGDQSARLGRRLAEARSNAARPEYRQEVVRGSARRAGRFVGSVKQAYRDGLEGDKPQ